MRRNRGTTIGSLMASIIKTSQRNKMGELHTIPHGYKFSEAGYTNPSGIYIAPLATIDGRLASLTRTRMVKNCPQPPGDYPTFKTDDVLRVYVPIKDCRKCQHHLKGERSAQYPCCAILREMRKEEPHPVATAFSMLREAQEQAKEIMGGVRR